MTDNKTSQKYVTSKRTGQLGMSLITIIKTTAGIIEFKKESPNELIDKSKSELIRIRFTENQPLSRTYLTYLRSSGSSGYPGETLRDPKLEIFIISCTK